jgi:hypothetical protein
MVSFSLRSQEMFTDPSLADIAATESSTTQMGKLATMDGNSMEHLAILAQRTAQPLHTSVVCARDMLSLARFIG